MKRKDGEKVTHTRNRKTATLTFSRRGLITKLRRRWRRTRDQSTGVNDDGSDCYTGGTSYARNQQGRVQGREGWPSSAGRDGSLGAATIFGTTLDLTAHCICQEFLPGRVLAMWYGQQELTGGRWAGCNRYRPTVNLGFHGNHLALTSC